MSGPEAKAGGAVPEAIGLPLTLPFIHGAARPLHLVFWGSLLVLFDVQISQTVNGRGWQFDFLNDFAGMLMICAGVFRLARIPVHNRYKAVMGFVKVVAVLTAIEAFRGHFIQPWPEWISVLAMLVSLAVLPAMILFCVAMRWLALESRLLRAARSWQITIVLMAVIYALPLGSFYLIALGAMLMQRSFYANLGVAALLLLLPVFALPLIFLLVSTIRMRNEAAALTAAPAPPPMPVKQPPGSGLYR